MEENIKKEELVEQEEKSLASPEKETQLSMYIKAKRPILYINHYDYVEIDKMLKSAVKDIEKVKIYEYRAIGEVDFVTKKIMTPDAMQTEKLDALSFLTSYYLDGVENNVFLLLKDIDEELKNPEVLAMIKKIAELNVYQKEYNCTIIVVSKSVDISKDLEDYVSIVEVPKLNSTEIEDYIRLVAKNMDIKVNEEDIGEIAISLKGLSKWYITQILNMMDTISLSNIQKIIKEKGQIIKKSGMLELIDFKEKIEDIGGLHHLKEWLDGKAKIFRRLDEAKKFGVDTPKGVLLVGMPGCGKSLTAKAASRMFNVPLLRLDIGRLLGKYVGESEHNLREALKTAESISPCILWIDEIEKAFAGVNQTAGASDITKRLFGQFLTWMQEKENTVFVVATSNDISSFPPEFLRKGRFDEIFFIDFPNKYEREEIFRIHLEKRFQYNEEYIDLAKLASKTEGFCGADIEEAVKIAVEELFIDNLEYNEDEEEYDKDDDIDEEQDEDEINVLDTSDIIKSIEKIDSIESIIKEKIDALRAAYEKFKLKKASMNENEIQKMRAEMQKNKAVATHKRKKGVMLPNDGDYVFVQGGKYKPSFYTEEREVKDLYVSKYQITQESWQEIMDNNPSYFKGPRRPIESITWLEALEYCNALSESEGLMPVYKIEDGKLNRIIYANGEEVYPSLADFSKTNGYRLPTSLEWEWFARGGEIALQDGKFDQKYAGSDNLSEVAWYERNSNKQTHDVGTKRPNALGLHDCTGNLWEWCYDTGGKVEYLDEVKSYIYDGSVDSHILRGGSWNDDVDYCAISHVLWREFTSGTRLGSWGNDAFSSANSSVRWDTFAFISYGFRAVRTV